jgi:epoxyqueuosine reductase
LIGGIHLKEELIKFCNSINIELVGIASAEPYLDFEKVWRKQIEKGYVTGFEEKDIAKRVYPHLTLEGAQSVIVCLFPYYTGHSDDANLSKYTYGLDYHVIVKKKLETIATYMSELIPDFVYKCFADTGPFSDRYLAHKAGLGFWGLNNLLITDKYGSYVFIGYILNNYPFPPDKPLDKTCDRCFACIKKCPGKCIIGDYTINPLKCRSYITQKKTELSTEDISILKKGTTIWGCDVCQDVCPHNQRAKETVIEEFKKDLKYNLDYEELAEISNKEFLRRYKNRAFSWRGKAVLKRNYEIIYGKNEPKLNDRKDRTDEQDRKNGQA